MLHHRHLPYVSSLIFLHISHEVESCDISFLKNIHHVLGDAVFRIGIPFHDGTQFWVRNTSPDEEIGEFLEGDFDLGSDPRACSENPDLALLISCVGRKLILKQRIEEEVDGVREALGATTKLTGFYSYGEISPFTPGAKCELHNQTMTITTFLER